MMQILIILLTLSVTVEAKSPLPTSDELANLLHQSSTSGRHRPQRQLPGEGSSFLKSAEAESTPPPVVNFKADPLRETTSTEKPSQVQERSVKVPPPQPQKGPAPPQYTPAAKPPPPSRIQLPLPLPIYGTPYKITIPIPLPKQSNSSYEKTSYIPLVIDLISSNLHSNYYSNFDLKSVIIRPAEPSEYPQPSVNNTLPIQFTYRPPSPQQVMNLPPTYKYPVRPRPSYQQPYAISQPSTRNPYYPPPPPQYQAAYSQSHPTLTDRDIYAVPPEYEEPQELLVHDPQPYQEPQRPLYPYEMAPSYEVQPSRGYVEQEFSINPLTGEVTPIQTVPAPSRSYRSYNYNDGTYQHRVMIPYLYTRRQSPHDPIFEEH